MHRVELVRPGPASLAWLPRAVGEQQASDRLARVTVVVPSPYIGHAVRRALAERGCASVRTLLYRQLAAHVAGATVADTRSALTGVLEQAAVRAALRDRGRAFQQLEHQRSLHDAFTALFRELRHHPAAESVLADLEARGGVASAAATVYRRYLELTARYFDVPELARLAASAADRPSARWPAEIGALVLYLPPRLDAVDVELLGRIGRRAPVFAAFPWFGEELADREPRETARLLANALGCSEPTVSSPGAVAPAGARIVSAPDPAEEARLAVRRVAADLESGIPLWRTALLYGRSEPYGALLRETLDAAGLPWHAAEGRSAATGWAARSLLGLLALREQRFARAAVLEWLASRPPASTGTSTHDLTRTVSASAWDRLSRQAGVLEGARQWVERLQALANGLQGGSARDVAYDDDDVSGSDLTPPATGDAALARGIAAAIARLDADTRPPPSGSTWDAFFDWAVSLRARYVPTGDDWPAAEREAADALDAALESLRAAQELEPATALPIFLNALSAAVEGRRLPEGVTGVGVLVGTFDAVPGAAFERVHLLGLSEGAFPARPPIDPLAAPAGLDPLRRRERRLESDRRALLGALSAADDGDVVASYPRSDGGAREAYPSRWLLALASEREGRPVYASDLSRLFVDGRPWLDRVASAHEAAVRLAAAGGSQRPADLHDLRLGGVVAWSAARRDLLGHPLALRGDLPLGAALRAARARRSRTFTPFDGNLAELAATSRRLAEAFGSGWSSASSVERWAICPFQYLLQHVLRVAAVARPDEEWDVDAATRGRLVHEILDRFFRALCDEGRFGPEDRFTPADHDRLDALADAVFQQAERSGTTGHPLSWENARATIRSDLHRLLEKDERWRRDERLRPRFFERSFGWPDRPDSWPPATVVLPDGRAIPFRGVIDRIDVSQPGEWPRRAQVIDYKSGSADPYKKLRDADPLLGGRRIQLALYARALATGLPEEDADVE
ncbi:MAG: PD-(D/E)XK nuclease family protein, partial [Chloroflexi bacterium]|nr:PD-(D/E)XK nuclease family protein [Chloroflexota bacterium]